MVPSTDLTTLVLYRAGETPEVRNVKSRRNLMTTTVLHHPSAAAGAAPVTHHRTNKVDGVNIFYREAGPADAPVVLLLHGFPTSSHMFRNLIPALADCYHLIAPDYPGFGQSDMPDRATFAYTFDRFAELIDGLVDQLGVTRYAMYVMDYGPQWVGD
jgi:hypothetical protein